MKTIFGIACKTLAHGSAAIVLGSALLVSVASADGDAVVRSAGNLSYVSGGVGAEAQERLRSLAANFNLKLVFALNSGAYLSGVRVAIADTTGRKLLDATSEGPWFLANLPAGDYQIVASLAGKAQTQRISVGAAKLRTVDFRWVAE